MKNPIVFMSFVFATLFSVGASATDCAVSAWGSWSPCSEPCDSTQWGGALGMQTRTRTIVVQPTTDGVQCPPLEQSQACNTQVCEPVDCEISLSAWGTCSEPCDGGIQARTITVLTEPAYGGAACPTPATMQTCNTQACVPIDCEVQVSDWSACSKLCDGGMRTRTVTVVTQPQYGGAACPMVVTEEVCNAEPCVVDCELSEWSAWSACSAPCGEGMQMRSRTVLVEAANGGQACGALTGMMACNAGACVCGDGIVSDSETCDLVSADGECRDDCTFCGDGIVDAVEECDDANAVDGDGCSECVTDVVEPDMGVADMGEGAEDMNPFADVGDADMSDDGIAADMEGADDSDSSERGRTLDGNADDSCAAAGGAVGLPALTLMILGLLSRRVR